MEKVAKYYGLPSVNFAADVGSRLAAGEFDWIKDFGGVHPAPFGNRIYCGHIETLFEKARKQRGNMPEIPAGLMDGNSLVHRCFIDPGTADRWHSPLGGTARREARTFHFASDFVYDNPRLGAFS